VQAVLRVDGQLLSPCGLICHVLIHPSWAVPAVQTTGRGRRGSHTVWGWGGSEQGEAQGPCSECMSGLLQNAKGHTLKPSMLQAGGLPAAEASQRGA
jgi:hypothetical protein